MTPKEVFVFDAVNGEFVAPGSDKDHEACAAVPEVQVIIAEV